MKQIYYHNEVKSEFRKQNLNFKFDGIALFLLIRQEWHTNHILMFVYN